jgi:hypothetical protein
LHPVAGLAIAAPHRTRLATSRPLVARRFRQTRAPAIFHPVAKKFEETVRHKPSRLAQLQGGISMKHVLKDFIRALCLSLGLSGLIIAAASASATRRRVF